MYREDLFHVQSIYTAAWSISECSLGYLNHNSYISLATFCCKRSFFSTLFKNIYLTIIIMCMHLNEMYHVPIPSNREYRTGPFMSTSFMILNLMIKCGKEHNLQVAQWRHTVDIGSETDSFIPEETMYYIIMYAVLLFTLIDYIYFAIKCEANYIYILL